MRARLAAGAYEGAVAASFAALSLYGEVGDQSGEDHHTQTLRPDRRAARTQKKCLEAGILQTWSALALEAVGLEASG